MKCLSIFFILERWEEAIKNLINDYDRKNIYTFGFEVLTLAIFCDHVELF